MTDPQTRTDARRTATVLPVVFAIFVFGSIYGASQAELYTPATTVATSLFIFSGAAQFAAAGLLNSGATAAAVLGTIVVLNLRHLLLGAVMRQRLQTSPARRALLAFFLIDETVGLAVADPQDPLRTYLLAGVGCYLAWVSGTVLGVVGGQALGDPQLAAAVFPVLFVGLAAAAVRGGGDAVRAFAAAALTLLLIATVPAVGGLAPIIVALALATLGRSGR